MGKWYEFARFNHRFDRGMDGVTAQYSLREDGKIKVLNRGWKKGAWHLIKGKAKLPDKSQPGKLRVSFFPFIYSDYYVMELDEEHYSYAIVGSSSDKYLWILSRTKELSALDKTIEYYNQNADMFVQGTRLVDFTVVQERFAKMLPVGSRILDFGCGSG